MCGGNWELGFNFPVERPRMGLRDDIRLSDRSESDNWIRVTAEIVVLEENK